jgi:hypothetical protein
MTKIKKIKPTYSRDHVLQQAIDTVNMLIDVVASLEKRIKDFETKGDKLSERP